MRLSIFISRFVGKFARPGMQTGRVMLLTAALLVAQFGIAMHPLHLDGKQSGQKVELTCAFCIAGSHLGAAPTAPVIHLDSLAVTAIDARVGDVCAILFLSTPRLTRGPPLSTPV